MNRLLSIITVLILITGLTNAQTRYISRTAKVTFLSEAPLERIEGRNSQGTSVFDSKTGQFEFAILIKAFEFEQALLQDHFNENYMESTKFPKSTFKGTIQDIANIDLMKAGTYPVKVKGQLTIHGVTKEVSTDGTLEVKGDKVIGKANFEVACADYNIEIPSLVKDKIAKFVKIAIEAPYQKM
jgi:polyisoprenoid-binding protein YceI